MIDIQHMPDIYCFPGFVARAWVKTKPGDASAIVITLVRRRKKKFCSSCERTYYHHYDVRSRLVRDLSSGDRKVYLDVPMRRVACSECDVKTEKLNWLASLPRYTHRFALFVGERCRESSLTDVARQTGLHWQTVKDLDKLYREELLRRAGPL
jgi:transposase